MLNINRYSSRSPSLFSVMDHINTELQIINLRACHFSNKNITAISNKVCYL